MIHNIYEPGRTSTVNGTLYQNANCVGALSGLYMGSIGLQYKQIYGITYELAAKCHTEDTYIYPILYVDKTVKNNPCFLIEMTDNARYLFDPRGNIWQT